LSSGKATGSWRLGPNAAEFDKNDTLASFMERIKERDAERIVMDDLDAVFLRNDSIEDLQERPWAIPRGVVFGQMLKAREVTVVNNPMSLTCDEQALSGGVSGEDPTAICL
jgi:glutathione synthase